MEVSNVSVNRNFCFFDWSQGSARTVEPSKPYRFSTSRPYFLTFFFAKILTCSDGGLFRLPRSWLLLFLCKKKKDLNQTGLLILLFEYFFKIETMYRWSHQMPPRSWWGCLWTFKVHKIYSLLSVCGRRSNKASTWTCGKFRSSTISLNIYWHWIEK